MRVSQLTKQLGNRFNINWGHPLSNSLRAAWVFAQGADVLVSDTNTRNTFFDCVSGQKVVAGEGSLGSCGLVAGPTGYGYNFGTAANGAKLTGDTDTQNLFPTKDVSFFWRGSILGDPQGAQDSPIFGLIHNAFNSPFYAYGVCRDHSTAGNVFFRHSAGGTNNFTSITGAIDTTKYGSISSFGLTRSGDGAFSRFFSKGVKVGSDTVSGSMTYGATSSRVAINSDSLLGGGDNASTFIDVIYIWSRAISDAEQAYVAFHPYDLLQPIGLRRLFVSLSFAGKSINVIDDLNAGPWRDGLSYLGGNPDYKTEFGDNLDTPWSDTVAIGQGLSGSGTAFSDNLNFPWADVALVTPGQPLEVFDIDDKWLDAVSTFIGVLLQQTASDDNSPNWLDSILTGLPTILQFADTLTMLDPKLQITLDLGIPGLSDTLTISDLVTFLYIYVAIVADVLSQSDAVSITDDKKDPFSDSLFLNDGTQMTMDFAASFGDVL